MGRRRRFTKEFKIEAVRLAGELGNVRQVAHQLDISENSLHRWRRQLEDAGEKAFPGKGNPKDEELTRVHRENAHLREENVILKKAVGIFSSRPQ